MFCLLLLNFFPFPILGVYSQFYLSPENKKVQAYNVVDYTYCISVNWLASICYWSSVPMIAGELRFENLVTDIS